MLHGALAEDSLLVMNGETCMAGASSSDRCTSHVEGKHSCAAVCVRACTWALCVCVCVMWHIPAGCVDGNVRTVGASRNPTSALNTATSPEIFNQGEWHPICGRYFIDDQNGANTLCTQLGVCVRSVR